MCVRLLNWTHRMLRLLEVFLEKAWYSTEPIPNFIAIFEKQV